MTNAKKLAFGRHSGLWESGSKPYRHTRTDGGRLNESRVSRLKRRSERRGGLVRDLRRDYRLELKSVLLFLVAIALSAGLLGALLLTGTAADSNLGLAAAFSLGFIVTCALSSSLASLVTLRHHLLLLAASALAVPAGATLEGWLPLEGLAKILFATTTGLWIGMLLTSISQVLVISALIILVDFYSVFFGPTRKMVESGGPWIDYLTISLPVFGAPAFSRIGMSDIIFFAIFISCTLTFGLRRTATALAMTASFVVTMILGISFDAGVPALPMLSLSFLVVNCDRLYRLFLQEPDEHRK